MSILLASGELSPQSLAQRVLELTPFRHVSQDDYRELLRHLISLNHIERTEEGTLIVGLAGEKVTGSYHFYAVFRDDVEFTVYEEGQQVGTIVNPPATGERFGLAGRAWEVIESDPKRRIVLAKRIKGRVPVKWRGTGGEIHNRILQRMRQVLTEDVVYPYLQPGAQARLQGARALAKTLSLENKMVFSLSETRHCIFPWLGTVFFRTLTRILQHADSNELHGLGVSGFSPYYLIITTHNPVTAAEFDSLLSDLLCQEMPATDLIGPEEEPRLEKYDDFVPASLLRRSFAIDRLDVHGLANELPKLLNQHQNISNPTCAINTV
jgi:ATP-dependent Lhr-like helicase